MSEGFTELLYKALDSRIGIVVRTSNPDLCRQKLYAARAKACDPVLEELSIKPSHSSPRTELWIIRKTLKENPNE